MVISVLYILDWWKEYFKIIHLAKELVNSFNNNVYVLYSVGIYTCVYVRVCGCVFYAILEDVINMCAYRCANDKAKGGASFSQSSPGALSNKMCTVQFM